MEGFIGEVRMFAGNFAPRSWAFCEGQLLAIAQNSALFSILGTTYGGDGRTTFALPDLRGRAPIGQGNGPGLSDRRLGAKGGQATVTLTVSQIPAHSHSATLQANKTVPVTDNPNNAYPGPIVGRANTAPPATIQAAAYANSTNVTMKSDAVVVDNTGGNQSINIMQPYIPIYYIIALFGVYPSRS
ncbi:MAG: tail fiber protein [Bacteroidota bacterium]